MYITSKRSSIKIPNSRIKGLIVWLSTFGAVSKHQLLFYVFFLMRYVTFLLWCRLGGLKVRYGQQQAEDTVLRQCPFYGCVATDSGSSVLRDPLGSAAVSWPSPNSSWHVASTNQQGKSKPFIVNPRSGLPLSCVPPLIAAKETERSCSEAKP